MESMGVNVTPLRAAFGLTSSKVWFQTVFQSVEPSSWMCYDIPSPLFLAALRFVASVPSSYLAGGIVCLTDECLAP